VIGTPDTLQAQIIEVEPGYDYIVIQGLSSTEFVVVNGFTKSSIDIPAPVTLNFSNLDSNGTLYIYVDRFTKYFCTNTNESYYYARS